MQQRLHSFKFTLVNKSHSQHSEAAVHCLGRHFLMFLRMRTRTFVPRPKTSVIGLEATSRPVGSTIGMYSVYLRNGIGNIDIVMHIRVSRKMWL